jgi:hypothetical protein
VTYLRLLANQLLVVVTGCAVYFPPAPTLPARFTGALAVVADSIFSRGAPSYCAPTEHLDYGRVPQGCVRESGDTTEWVNWADANHVTRVVRWWHEDDNESAIRAGRRLEEQIAAQLGSPLRCPAPPVDERLSPPLRPPVTALESRWTARSATGVSTAVIVRETTPGGRAYGFPVRPARPAVVLIRTLGPERCGARFFAPRRCRTAFACRNEADSLRTRKSTTSFEPIERRCAQNLG